MVAGSSVVAKTQQKKSSDVMQNFPAAVNATGIPLWVWTHSPDSDSLPKFQRGTAMSHRVWTSPFLASPSL